MLRECLIAASLALVVVYGSVAMAGESRPIEKAGAAQEPQGNVTLPPKSVSKEKDRGRRNEDDVKSRGLFTKKKKKRTSGGAATHSEPTEQSDLPLQGEPGTGK